MHLQTVGRSINVGEALRVQVSERLDTLLAQYVDGGWSGQVAVEREDDAFHTECRVDFDSGIGPRARTHAENANRSFDQAAEPLGRRLRCYKRRLKAYGAEPGEEIPTAIERAIVTDQETQEQTEHVDDHPVIIAETETRLRRITVGMAVMELDDEPVMVFRDATAGRPNVVYRRADGNIGWIDPPRNGEQEARS